LNPTQKQVPGPFPHLSVLPLHPVHVGQLGDVAAKAGVRRLVSTGADHTTAPATPILWSIRRREMSRGVVSFSSMCIPLVSPVRAIPLLGRLGRMLRHQESTLWPSWGIRPMRYLFCRLGTGMT